jgi:hypothetical protein
MLKDISDELQEKILNDEEESSARRTFTGSTGKEYSMPKEVFTNLIKKQRYFEVEYLEDVKNDWKKISKREMVDLDLLKFFATEIQTQLKENPHLMDEIKKDNTAIEGSLNKILRGKQRKDMLSKITGGKMSLPKTATASIYLTSVKLEKTESFKYGSLEGSYYNITDQKGTVIEAVHFKESIANDVFTNKKTNPQDVREQLDMSRLDPRPMVVVCVPFDSTEPMLQIIRVQSGGKSIDPLIPTIPGV